ncbi:hypothetical protein BOTBODRAFT_173016 [Botryobasidium botryosum FD-172 SS1]|uniref:Uncharacterized protein n=1 Tax=Botryobasidium botryosum (strain FD-172 SS1) TaxID=930990 RepID=A0A067MLS4_BOTB1|nr:hypothetical protein BOTBODRAFT_173016 [Botryobasidium botryosum FD-172 SS1]
MGRYWQAYTSKHLDSGGKIAESIWDREPHALASHLIVPAKPSSINASISRRRALPATQTIDQLLGYLNLPTEILIMIFNEIDNFPDAFSLAYTNTYLLAAGQDILCALLKARETQWAGDRIVCIGDYAQNNDLPQGMLTTAEMQGLLAFESDEVPRNLYGFADKKYQKPREYDKGWVETNEFGRKLQPYTNGSASIACKALERSNPTIVYSATFPGANTMYDFGTIHLTRICWLSANVWEHNGKFLDCGVWAGDRFEITTMDAMHERINKGEAWDDISASMLEDIRTIGGLYIPQHAADSERDDLDDGIVILGEDEVVLATRELQGETGYAKAGGAE